jgi:hypothetical protein
MQLMFSRISESAAYSVMIVRLTRFSEHPIEMLTTRCMMTEELAPSKALWPTTNRTLTHISDWSWPQISWKRFSHGLSTIILASS